MRNLGNKKGRIGVPACPLFTPEVFLGTRGQAGTPILPMIYLFASIESESHKNQTSRAND